MHLWSWWRCFCRCNKHCLYPTDVEGRKSKSRSGEPQQSCWALPLPPSPVCHRAASAWEKDVLEPCVWSFVELVSCSQSTVRQDCMPPIQLFLRRSRIFFSRKKWRPFVSLNQGSNSKILHIIMTFPSPLRTAAAVCSATLFQCGRFQMCTSLCGPI